MNEGVGGFVLPKYKNTVYVKIQIGDHFGVADIISSYTDNQLDHTNWISRKTNLKRLFTVQALADVMVLGLSIESLHNMYLLFPEYYDMLFQQSIIHLGHILMMRCKATKECEKQFMKYT